jgi:hypothetical protein
MSEPEGLNPAERDMVIFHAALPPTAKLVALCLAHYANKRTDRAYPSVATVSKLTGYDRSTIQRQIRWLQKRRYIKYVGINLRTGTTIYEFQWPRFVDDHEFGKKMKAPRGGQQKASRRRPKR